VRFDRNGYCWRIRPGRRGSNIPVPQSPNRGQTPADRPLAGIRQQHQQWNRKPEQTRYTTRISGGNGTARPVSCWSRWNGLAGSFARLVVVNFAAEPRPKTVPFPFLEGEREGAAAERGPSGIPTINYLDRTIIGYCDHSQSRVSTRCSGTSSVRGPAAAGSSASCTFPSPATIRSGTGSVGCSPFFGPLEMGVLSESLNSTT
jgi:hypothetical protein